MNTHFTPDEIAYVIDDCEAKAVVIDESMAELAERVLPDTVTARRASRERNR